MSTSEKPSPLKIALVTVLMVGAGIFFYLQWRSTHPTIEPPAQQQIAGPMPRNPEEFQRIRAEIEERIGLTDEQRAQIEALGGLPGPDVSREERQARREALLQVLTPEQRDRLRDELGQRMREGLQRHLEQLPPDQQERFMRRLEERRAERGGMFGGPGFPAPGDRSGNGGREQ